MGSRFCMEVRMDSPNKLQKVQNITKVLITQPFFELQTTDFGWKFIWTVQPNDKVQTFKKYKKYKNSKIAKNDKNRKKSKKCKKYKSKKKTLRCQLLVQKIKIE